jgi:hypothetical protein
VTFGLALTWYLMAEQAITLIEQAEPTLRWNGAACMVAAVGTGYALVWRFRGKTCDPEAGGTH